MTCLKHPGFCAKTSKQSGDSRTLEARGPFDHVREVAAINPCQSARFVEKPTSRTIRLPLRRASDDRSHTIRLKVFSPLLLQQKAATGRNGRKRPYKMVQMVRELSPWGFQAYAMNSASSEAQRNHRFAGTRIVDPGGAVERMAPASENRLRMRTAQALAATPSGSFNQAQPFRWLSCAQPPANICDPSGVVLPSEVACADSSAISSV